MRLQAHAPKQQASCQAEGADTYMSKCRMLNKHWKETPNYHNFSSKKVYINGQSLEQHLIIDIYNSFHSVSDRQRPFHHHEIGYKAFSLYSAEPSLQSPWHTVRRSKVNDFNSTVVMGTTVVKSFNCPIPWSVYH
jgi:hypothetical protein